MQTTYGHAGFRLDAVVAVVQVLWGVHDFRARD